MFTIPMDMCNMHFWLFQGLDFIVPLSFIKNLKKLPRNVIMKELTLFVLAIILIVGPRILFKKLPRKTKIIIEASAALMLLLMAILWSTDDQYKASVVLGVLAIMRLMFSAWDYIELKNTPQ